MAVVVVMVVVPMLAAIGCDACGCGGGIGGGTLLHWKVLTVSSDAATFSGWLLIDGGYAVDLSQPAQLRSKED